MSDRISSKDFEKLDIGSMTLKLLEYSEELDQIFCSFAERLRKLGAVKPLTIVVDSAVVEGWPQDFRSVWPLFSELGIVELGDDEQSLTR